MKVRCVSESEMCETEVCVHVCVCVCVCVCKKHHLWAVRLVGSSHPRVLNSLTPAQSLVRCRVTYSQGPGLRTQTSLGTVIHPHHPPHLNLQPLRP